MKRTIQVSLISLVISAIVFPVNGCISQSGVRDAEAAGAPFFIHASMGIPDSAGGRAITFAFRNLGSNDIKYVDIETRFYNQVGDVVQCSYGYNDRVRFTGPIGVNQTETGSPPKCYDMARSKLTIYNVVITYMDDSEEGYTIDELAQVKAVHQNNLP